MDKGKAMAQNMGSPVWLGKLSPGSSTGEVQGARRRPRPQQRWDTKVLSIQNGKEEGGSWKN